MKNLIVAVGIVILAISFADSITANAAGKKTKSEVVMKMGSKLHLFHSGAVQTNKEILLAM